jgi:FO synthase subunit 2
MSEATLPPNDSLDRLLGTVRLPVARTLSDALEGRDITVDQAVDLLNATGLELNATVMVADELRRRAVGDIVTYVVNRNINFTNVCIKRCGFCAFSRDHRTEEGYLLPTEEIVRRAREAWDLGATEVCVQAGLPPQMEGDLYIRLTEAIKAELPDIHIHGFSPEEVLYGAVRSKCSIADYLKALKNAGVGSLPGTSAEILDQDIRDRIAPGRINVAQWTEVITAAHKLGIPTTSTIMYGHVESPEHQARHIAYIRDIQIATGGFTEFVPLSFINAEAPMFFRKKVSGVRPGATGLEVLRMHAVSRIMLNNWIPNLQVSWVKEGLKLSQMLLSAGVNDMGGSLINESISTAAGALHGQLVRPSEFRHAIRDAGRIPAERHTTYTLKRIFDTGDEPLDPLDLLEGNPEDRFGSYRKLVNTSAFRFHHPKKTVDAPTKSNAPSAS